MTERKLLELAAKAAGLIPNSFLGNADYMDGLLSGARPWNPLTDDGDALRLAVKLDIYVMQVTEQGHVSARVRNGARTAFNEPIGANQYAATRRAIVRAAAEIGEATP